METITWALGFAFGLSLAVNTWTAKMLFTMRSDITRLGEGVKFARESVRSVGDKLDSHMKEVHTFMIEVARDHK